MKKIIRGVITGTILGFALGMLIILALENANARVISGYAEVTDGDGLKIDGEKIRIAHIDAPEKKQVCCKKGKAWACGEDSKAELENLVKGKIIACQYKTRGRYGRIIGDPCIVGDTDIAEHMIKEGLAVTYKYKSKGKYRIPNKKYYDQEQNSNKGLWESDFVQPYMWRKGTRAYCEK